jgi:CDP-diglyceride synthetase
MARNKTVALVGAFAGFALFLGLGLLPSLMYGGYAGLLLAGGIFGTPVPASLAARGLVGLGMVLGVIGAASVFTVLGAAVASLFGHLASVKPVEQLTPAHAKSEAK